MTASGTSRTRVLVVTLDRIAEQMAGPAIRAWEIATFLSAEHDVRLLTFGECRRTATAFDIGHVEIGEFRAAVEEADVVVLQGYVAATFPWLQQADVVLVVDLYDPFHIESLEVLRDRPLAERDASLASALRELDAQVRRGDVFLCASPRQRDLWIGHLAAAGRLNPLVYDADPSLRELVRLVPFGVADAEPLRTAPAIKGVVPGIAEDDLVILWGGGVYNWFDPLTLVRAVDLLKERVPRLRLYFLGMRHPNPDVPEMRTAVWLRELAHELGLVGTHVFFNEEWVPYERRADYLLDADLGVSCHFPHVETEFSFRTRILDYLWAGLPIVSTDGDAFAPLIRHEGLGRVVPAEDEHALAAALEELLTDDAARTAAAADVRRVARGMTWSHVLQPLAEICASPRRSADAGRLPPAVADAVRPARRLRDDAAAAVRHLRMRGVRHTAGKVRDRWRAARAR
ncbi:glycosyltransferase family 4 protein [Cellulomonas dongxiuzhuiae]|uniref:glycosyltransferase family 4 protein n=1 Tax=Cellulomonas dongxiuzhuiae TaxID=2819979 RepID=UPI0027DD3A68|nr:glycosyltransferase family 4 protein [Cellulomonas dongxiuzhuiae]